MWPKTIHAFNYVVLSIQTAFSRILGRGKGSGVTPIAVYFCASPSARDANWITLATKGGVNDIKSIVSAGLFVYWPACLFIHTSLCGQSYLISIPSAWGCAEVNSYWSCTRPFFPTQYTVWIRETINYVHVQLFHQCNWWFSLCLGWPKCMSLVTNFCCNFVDQKLWMRTQKFSWRYLHFNRAFAYPW